jgi:acylpyruvate hydrolase
VKLATFVPSGTDSVHTGAVSGHHVTAFTDGTTVLDRLTSGDTSPARGESWPLSDVRLLAPVPQPRAIYGIGLNYADHVAETGGQAPEAPIVFQKPPTASAPPDGPVRIPEVSRRMDYEGELTIVMGAGGNVAGFAIADDVTARDLQGREPQWTRAKGADTFCPWGPWVTTADEVGDPESLELRTWVNGELRQESSTSNLIFGVSALVRFLMEAITLQPGDLILTGTPSGVGFAMDPPRFLDAGDRVRIEIQHLGAIEHEIVR